MFEVDVNEAKVKLLMTEYQELTEELMKKECYLDGLKERICHQAKLYYDTYLGRWSHMYFDKNFIDNAEVRASDIRLKFYDGNINVLVTVAVNPSDLRKDLKLNAKEKKLLGKAKKLWKEVAEDRLMYNLEEFEKISFHLMDYENQIELVNEECFCFKELDLMNGTNICVGNLVIGKCNGTDVLLNMFENKIK